jgi:hypothetical protein
MKNTTSVLVLAFILLLSAVHASAQKIPDSIAVNSAKTYVITKNDGSTFTGKIISMDAREVLIDTRTIGQVSIPKHEIKEIKEVPANQITSKGEFKPNETFATRYFLTTNGLPIEKGESYILWNWYGPDFQFGVGKNFGLGIMTSWLGMPVIGSAKYSFELGKDTHMAVGTLLGTGSWALPHFGMALPFTSLTYGNRRNNITFSGGYGAIWYEGYNGGRTLFSVAGMAKVSKKASFVFDSFILPGNTSDHNYVSLYMPGIRIQTAQNKAFQFGFAGIATVDNFSPIPMFQWFRML